MKTLKEYVTELNDYLESHPEQANLPVVTSIDDEGNGFNFIHFTPTFDEYEVRGEEVEAVCVN